MTQYMLMFSLGPVQPFIEQARKTRDLWLGSYLLSKLMEAAMEHIRELGGEFVFPFDRNVKDEYANLPNKYIAIFADLGRAKRAAEKSRDQIYSYWDTLRAGVWDEMVQWCADSGTEEIWKRQSNPEACFEGSPPLLVNPPACSTRLGENKKNFPTSGKKRLRAVRPG